MMLPKSVEADEEMLKAERALERYEHSFRHDYDDDLHNVPLEHSPDNLLVIEPSSEFFRYFNTAKPDIAD